MKQFEVFSDVKDDGNLQQNVRLKVAAELKAHIGKRIHIIIKRVGVQRSDRQNRYYFGVVIQYQIDCFYERQGEIWDTDQMHDWNKNNIWHTEIIDKDTGEVIKKPGSSKAANKSEFEFRMEKLRQKFELEYEWKIPLPNEQLDAF